MFHYTTSPSLPKFCRIPTPFQLAVILSETMSKILHSIDTRANTPMNTLLTHRLSRTFVRSLAQPTRMATQPIRMARGISTSRILLQTKVQESKIQEKHITAETIHDVTGPDSSLIGPGAQPGTIPTDMDQATGLERYEILGKREGIDVFDMEKPIKEGSGTLADPFLVPTYIGYRYVGCRGKGGEDHKAYWMKVEEGEPARCWHCGTVYAAKYLGEPGHSHH